MAKIGTHCTRCNRPYDQEWIDEKNANRSVQIKESLRRRKEKGMNVGRPRQADYEKIKLLRSQGLTLGKIGSELGVSRGSIQAALKS